jgi:thymidine phosphorylase
MMHTSADETAIVATLNVVHGELIRDGEIGLSEIAWRRLGARDGEPATLSHPESLDSFGFVRAKLYGQHLSATDFKRIIDDIAANRYTDVQLSAFVSACTLARLDQDEIVSLTSAMVDAGERLEWGYPRVMDKHCVGGLPRNRTTPIVVAIVAACGVPLYTIESETPGELAYALHYLAAHPDVVLVTDGS